MNQEVNFQALLSTAVVGVNLLFAFFYLLFFGLGMWMYSDMRQAHEYVMEGWGMKLFAWAWALFDTVCVIFFIMDHFVKQNQ